MGQQKCLSRLMEVTKEKRCSWGYQTEKTDFQILIEQEHFSKLLKSFLDSLLSLSLKTKS